MVAILGMGVVVDAAGPVVAVVGGYDENHGYNDHPGVLFRQKLLGSQKYKAYGEKAKGQKAMVMPAISVPQGSHSDHKSQHDHKNFKGIVMDQLKAQNRQAIEEQRQQGAMDGTGYGGRNA